MKTPFLLLLDGMTGSGKTTVSNKLAEKIPRLATIGLDKVKLFINDFERGDRDNNIGRNIISEMTKIYLTNGISVIVDQPIRSSEINLYEDIAKEYSVPIYKIQLFADTEVVFSRIVDRMKSWDKPTSEEQVRTNISFFKSKKDIGFHQIDTNTKSIEEVVREVFDILNTQ
jgi:adenylate kinase family enzyme